MLVSPAPTSLPLLFSSYLTLALSSPPCPLLHLSFYLNLLQELSSLSCSIRLQWVPGHSFLPCNDSADELARRGALLVPTAISCSLSPLISRIHFSVFSDWKHTVSSKILAHRLPRFPPRNLCSLFTLAVSFLVYAATDTVFCKASISLELAESRILAGLVDTRPRTPLISFCAAQLRTLRRSLFGNFLSLYDLSGPCPVELPGFWGLIVFRHAPIRCKGSGNNNNNNSKTEITDALLLNKES